MAIKPVPLTWILPSFNKQHTNALPIPNHRPEDYLQLLISALREGWIELVSNHLPVNLGDAITAVTRFKKQGLEKPGNGLLFRLTDAGGKAWESLAEPRWGRFLKSEMTTLGSDLDDLRVYCLLASKNQDAVVAYLGWYERLQSVDVDWSTLRLVAHANYKATYWKRLTDVHEASFNGVLQKADRSIPAPVWDWKMSLGNWHVKPWDRPDWS